MQIDILSSNTLKLTLSRLDMFDLDIKYESLSGKNPETKRLLAHVLKKIRLDQLDRDSCSSHDRKLGFDFSCERIFVEAFPRPDGGCMLYVSSLEADSGKKKRSSAKSRAGDDALEMSTFGNSAVKREIQKNIIIYETESLTELSAVCKALQLHGARLSLESSLHKSDNRYRLIIKTEKQPPVINLIREYGEVLKGERELFHTREYYKEIIAENAAGQMAELF